MTCQFHRQAILDLACGVAGIETREVRVHVRSCAACAAFLRRQRGLTGAFRELAAEARTWAPSACLEDRLTEAFGTAHALQAHPVARRSQSWRYGVAAAAAAMILVAAAAWWDGPAVAPVPQVEQASPPETSDTPRASDMSSSPAVARRTDDRTTAAAIRATGRPSPVRPRLPEPDRVRAIEFTMIPAAVDLPPLESARIVRMEVPVSALPDYGLQIVSDGRRPAVEADLLVGQDGLARGIRLLSLEREPGSSRSRQ
jgi:hypothetical protein